MIAATDGGLRFTLDLPSTHEPRHFRVRPISENEAGAVEELLRFAPGVSRRTPPVESSQAASLRLGAFDDMRVLRALVDLRAGAPAADACFIELMVVHPRFRRAGLGAALTVELLKRLHFAGARRVALEVDDGNDAAARFWTRQGFVETGRDKGRQSFEKTLA